MTYGKKVFVAVDQLFNALFGGWPDETLSSRAYREHLAGNPWPAWIVDYLACLCGDFSHCKASYESERQRRQLPPELRSIDT